MTKTLAVALLAPEYSFAIGDLGCFELPASAVGSCAMNKGTLGNLSQSMKTLLSQTQVNEIEGPFFWDYLKDQFEQSQCETDLIQNQYLQSGSDVCELGDKSKTNKSPGIAQENQLKIYNNLKANLKTLGPLYKKCESFKAAFVRTMSLNSLAQQVVLGHSLEVNIYEKHPLFIDGAEACSHYELIANSISPVQSTAIHDFVEAWSAEYSNTPFDKKDVEASVGLYAGGFKRWEPRPADVKEKMNPFSLGGPSKHRRSLDLNEMMRDSFCEAKKRHNKLESHMSNGTPRPGTFEKNDPAVGADLKELLLADSGAAAAAFFDRTKDSKILEKWGDFGDEFKCYLKSNYHDTPKTQRRVIRVAIGTTTMLVTLIVAAPIAIELAGGSAATVAAYTPGLSWAVASVILDTATAALATGRAIHYCGEEMFSNTSLQVQNVCSHKNRSGEEQKIINSQTSTTDPSSCTLALAEAVPSVAGSAFQILKASSALNSVRSAMQIQKAISTIQSATPNTPPSALAEARRVVLERLESNPASFKPEDFRSLYSQAVERMNLKIKSITGKDLIASGDADDTYIRYINGNGENVITFLKGRISPQFRKWREWTLPEDLNEPSLRARNVIFNYLRGDFEPTGFLGSPVNN